MIKEFQVTIFCETGKYKPVSCIIKRDTQLFSEKGKEAFFSEIRKAGVQKICIARGWDSRDLARYGYTKVKTRLYDKEKIEREQKEKYEQLKKEKGWT